MRLCTFRLNGEPMSAFEIAGQAFPEFSGNDHYVNARMYICVPDQGPLPVGAYYIVDRQSGGRLGGIYDIFSGSEKWFALYADDGRIDDETFCDKVKRGQFRLHAGRRSSGCITVASVADFNVIRGLLRDSVGHIPHTNIKCYGKVIVK